MISAFFEETLPLLALLSLTYHVQERFVLHFLVHLTLNHFSKIHFEIPYLRQGHAHFSKIFVLALRLSNKEHIKTVF